MRSIPAALAAAVLVLLLFPPPGAAQDSDSAWSKLPDSSPADDTSPAEDTPPDSNAPPTPSLPARSPQARLTLHTVPSGATLTLNGRRCGTTPLSDTLVPTGAYTIGLQRAGCKDFVREVFLGPGANRKLVIRLATRIASLTVLSDPPGAAVALNHRECGVTPFGSDSLEPGTYRLAISKPEYRTQFREITLGENSRDTLRFALVPQAYIDSVKQLRHTRGQRVRRIVFGALAAGCGAGGFYMNHRAAHELDQETVAHQDYLQPGLSTPEYDARWDTYADEKADTDLAMKRRNAFYVFGCVFAVGFGLSIPF